MNQADGLVQSCLHEGMFLTTQWNERAGPSQASTRQLRRRGGGAAAAMGCGIIRYRGIQSHFTRTGCDLPSYPPVHLFMSTIFYYKYSALYV